MTIKDVAKNAQVSIASVSRVMSGQPGVSAETASRIRKVMQEIGYRPNLGARGLVKRMTGNIAVVFPRGSSFILGNPFFIRVLEGISKVFDQVEYNTLFSFTSQQQKRLLETRAVDGVILFAPRTGEMDMDWMKKASIPTVIIGSYFDDSSFPIVRPDDKLGIQIAVHALHELGHRRIMLVNGPISSMKSIRCLEGYRLALEELGLEYREDDIVEVNEFDANRAADKVKGVLERDTPITGIVCVADFLAMGIIKAASVQGLSVPADVSVVGFGDVSFAEFFMPPLSTVHVDLFGIGEKAAEMLLDMINGKQIRKKERVFPMHFIARATTQPPHQ